MYEMNKPQIFQRKTFEKQKNRETKRSALGTPMIFLHLKGLT